MIRARAAAARSTRSATEEMPRKNQCLKCLKCQKCLKLKEDRIQVDSMKFPITGEQRTDNGQHATADMQPAMDN